MRLNVPANYVGIISSDLRGNVLVQHVPGGGVRGSLPKNEKSSHCMFTCGNDKSSSVVDGWPLAYKLSRSTGTCAASLQYLGFH